MKSKNKKYLRVISTKLHEVQKDKVATLIFHEGNKKQKEIRKLIKIIVILIISLSELNKY